jgi:hypothetical protein
LIGAWPSLVGHLLGVQVVAGSNPVAPTIPIKKVEHRSAFFIGMVIYRSTFNKKSEKKHLSQEIPFRLQGS